MNLLDQIRNAQRDTGEAAVIAHLDSLGLSNVTDKKDPYASEAETLIDPNTIALAESVGLIGPASRAHDLHAAIQRFHDLICVNATIKAAKMAAEAIGEATPPAAQIAVPGWINYKVATDVLTIHGKKYSAAMFGEDGFLAPVGTLLRIEDGPPECVTLSIINQDTARPACCAECGKKDSDGWALYCVACMDKIHTLLDSAETKLDALIAQATPTAAQTVPLTVQGYSEAMECEIISTDFSDNTITVEMKSKGWKVRAGTYWLGTTLPPVQDNQNHGDI